MMIREYVQKLEQGQLDQLWDEIEDWEGQGLPSVLPKECYLRMHTTLAYRLVVPEAGKKGHYCWEVAHEVWREIARRSRDGVS